VGFHVGEVAFAVAFADGEGEFRAFEGQERRRRAALAFRVVEDDKREVGRRLVMEDALRERQERERVGSLPLGADDAENERILGQTAIRLRGEILLDGRRKRMGFSA